MGKSNKKNKQAKKEAAVEAKVEKKAIKEAKKYANEALKSLFKDAEMNKSEKKEALSLYKKSQKKFEEKPDQEKTFLDYADILIQLGTDKIAEEACKQYPGLDGKLIAAVPIKFSIAFSLSAKIHLKQQQGNPNAFRDAIIEVISDVAIDKGLDALSIAVFKSNVPAVAVKLCEAFTPAIEEAIKPIEKELENLQAPKGVLEEMKEDMLLDVYYRAKYAIGIGRMMTRGRSYVYNAVGTFFSNDNQPKVVNKNDEKQNEGWGLADLADRDRELCKEIDKCFEMERQHEMKHNLC